MNSALDAMDPFVESWPFSFECLDNGVRKSLTLVSRDRMNILATPAVITPLAELLTFVNKCSTAAPMAHLSTSSTAQSYVHQQQQPSGKYRLMNLSGLPLNYWVEQEGVIPTERFSVMDGETIYLAVTPVAKAVLLPHANTRVRDKE